MCPGDVVLRSPLLAWHVSFLGRDTPHRRICSQCSRYTKSTPLSFSCALCRKHFCSEICKRNANNSEAHLDRVCEALTANPGYWLASDDRNLALELLARLTEWHENGRGGPLGIDEILDNVKLDMAHESADGGEFESGEDRGGTGEKEDEKNLGWTREEILKASTLVKRYKLYLTERKSSMKVSRDSGLYLATPALFMRHSCMPNLAYRLNLSTSRGTPPHVVFEAITPIKANESVSIAFIPISPDPKLRKNDLKLRQINCSCLRCKSSSIQWIKGKKGEAAAQKRTVSEWDQKHLCACGTVRYKPKYPSGGKPPVDLFKVLRVEYRALTETGVPGRLLMLKKAFRRSMLQWHPDKHPNDTIVAHRNAKLVNKAYAVLKEAAYLDHKLSNLHLRTKKGAKPKAKCSGQRSAAYSKLLTSQPSNKTSTSKKKQSRGKCRCAERPLRWEGPGQ
ncbi:hypothetical protein AAMO2058_000311400 [Amorphochlora amoebiformis]